MEQTKGFGLIDTFGLKRKHGLDGRLLWCDVKISDWVFNAIRANEVLTLNRDYFRLRKPIERRIYEIARKHCGKQNQWAISFDLLHKKSGSKSNIREFKRAIKKITESNHLPDYKIKYNNEKDQVIFKNREKWWENKTDKNTVIPLIPTIAYEEARQAAPHYDVYYLEQEFLNWIANSNKPNPKNIKSAFIGFCKKIHERKPYP
jgi:hypothetical protein